MAPTERPDRGRVVLALTAAVLVAWLASQILGEYELAGVLPFVAGPVVGWAVASVVATIGRWRDRAVGVFCAAAAASSLVWAGRIDAGPDADTVGASVWVAAVLAAAAAYLRIDPAVLRGREILRGRARR